MWIFLGQLNIKIDNQGAFKSDNLKLNELENRVDFVDAVKIANLNNKLQMEFENVDSFIGKLSSKENKADTLINDMATVLMSLDKIDPTAGGIDYTPSEEKKKPTGSNLLLF